MNEEDKSKDIKNEEQVISEYKEKVLQVLNPEDNNLDKSHWDSPVKSDTSEKQSPETHEGEILDQSLIDSLFQSNQKDGGSDQKSQVQEEKSQSTTQSKEEILPDLGQKVVAPPKKQNSEVALLSQDEIEALIELAQKEDKERQKKKQEILEHLETSTQLTAPIKSQLKPKINLKKYLIPITLSLILGLASGLGTYVYLMRNRIAIPEEVRPTYSKDISAAKEYAQILIEDKQYFSAISVLENALKNDTKPSADRIDAQFLLIKAKYLSGKITPDSSGFQELISDMESAVKENPTHPMAPLILFWKGRLHEEDHFPYPAIDTYERIIRNYPQFEAKDEVLFALSRLELQMNNTVKSVQWAQQLIKEFPASRYVLKARFNIAEAYRITGLMEDARTLYIRIVDMAPDTEIASLAILRLSEMAYNQGRYEQALVQLETKLKHIKQFQYNDEAYLLLAKTYRALGKLEEAKTTLQDLLVFFPNSSVHPQAWIELSQIFYALGNKEKAFQTANEASLLYPNHPEVLANKADFLALQGNTFASAVAYLEAEKNGGTNPSYLLKAGQLLVLCSQLNEAVTTFEKLKDRYYGTKEALLGSIDRAKCLYKLGKIPLAISELEDLKKLTPSTDSEYKNILKNLASMYHELGLKEAAVETASEWFQMEDNPEEKIEAGLILLNNDKTEMVYSSLKNIDLSPVNREKAHNFLYSLSKKLLDKNPPEGLSLIEQVYYQYPEYRTPELRYSLSEAYIKTERTTSARRIIQDWENEVGTSEESVRGLIDAEIMWGDYMFEMKEWDTASSAYKTAIQISQIKGTPLQGVKYPIEWAKYQYANILVEKTNFEEALKILEEIANSNSSISSMAQLKIEQIKLEMLAMK